MKRLGLVALLLTTLQLGVFAQASDHIIATTISVAEIANLTLPRLDNEELKAAELNRRGPNVPPRFAEVMSVDVSPSTHGTWETAGETAVWRLRVPSPSAHSLNFGFDQYDMPAGGKLLLYTPDRQHIQGPFTPADNEEHGQLWTPMVLGDDVIIEVSLPLAQKDDLVLHLQTVNHDFMGFGPATAAMSGSCNLDVVCGAEDGWGIVDQYRDLIQSVAIYGIGGGTTCTGFLINNARQDCTPYFITAAHCGVTPGNAPSIVVYWNYVSPECRQPNSGASGGPGGGVLTNFNTGTTYRAGYGPTDFILVELDDEIPASADAFFAGWDASTNLEQDTVIAVHHPNLDEKRISFEFDGVYRGAWGSGSSPVPDGNHIIIGDWDIGTTEPGSSGSPIFDSQKRFIGQLHGGGAACGNNLYDSYGWTHSSWEGGGSSSTRLRDWLDPDDTGILQLDGRSALLCTFTALAEPANQTLCAPASVVYEVAVGDTWGDDVALSVSGLPAGVTAVFDASTIAPGGSTQFTLTGTSALPTANYTFVLNGTDGTNTSNQTLSLNIIASTADAPVLTEPADLAIGTLTVLNLDWEEVTLAESYDLELAVDANFSTIVATASALTATDFQTPSLNTLTTYYWRVRATNACGAGDWSPAFTFQTSNLACGVVAAETTGLTIGPNFGAVTVSTIDITATGSISDLSISNFETNHTYLEDLVATLTSPDNITITLFDRPNCNQPGMAVDLTDDATATATDLATTCAGGGLAISGAFQPIDPFSAFDGEEIQGTWILTITDNANVDGGDLIGWELDYCLVANAANSITSNQALVNTCVTDGATATYNLGSGFGDNPNVTITSTPLTNGFSGFSTEVTAGVLAINWDNFNMVAPGNYTLNITVSDNGVDNLVTQDVTISAGPSLATLIEPANQTLFGASDVVFEWTGVSNADSYRLEVATDETFDMITETFTTTNTTTTLSLASDFYYWRVVTANECGESISNAFSFDFTVGTVEISGVALNVFPNPTNGWLQVEMDSDIVGNLRAEVFSLSGQRLVTRKWPGLAGTHRLDMNDLPAGAYFLRLINGAATTSLRIVKQ
ncbi:MAG: T9SS type A sorting domain-containing protein [Bacteroidota bacterium]